MPVTSRSNMYGYPSSTKTRVMLLAVFSALVAMMIVPVQLDPLRAWVAIPAIVAGAGGAGALNMWYDADIDSVMIRAARRPVPLGTVSPMEAPVFGLVLAGAAVAVLAFTTNLMAAGLLEFAIFFCVVVYTVFAETAHSPEHRYRRCRRRTATYDWLGLGNRKRRR
jgi:heme o synthase